MVALEKLQRVSVHLQLLFTHIGIKISQRSSIVWGFFTQKIEHLKIGTRI